MATLILKQQFTPTVQISKITVTSLLCLFILTIASLHLLHSNKSATRAYIIRKLEIQKSVLLSENQVLRMQTARARSLPRLSNNLGAHAMVPITSPRFAQR